MHSTSLAVPSKKALSVSANNREMAHEKED